MSTIGGKYPKYDPYKNRPFKTVSPYESNEVKFLKQQNAELMNALDKANKRIEELESKLKLFDEQLLEKSDFTNDDYRYAYITSIKLKNEKIEKLEKKIKEISKLEEENRQLAVRIGELELAFDRANKEIAEIKKDKKVPTIDKEVKEIKHTNKKKPSIKFNSPESLIDYFKKNLGKEFYSFSLRNTVINFLFEIGKDEFGWEDVSIYCGEKHKKKPVSATVHKHLNLLIDHDIIYRKHHGIYEVNEQLMNFG